jgi:hypothetical protein
MVISYDLIKSGALQLFWLLIYEFDLCFSIVAIGPNHGVFPWASEVYKGPMSSHIV